MDEKEERIGKLLAQQPNAFYGCSNVLLSHIQTLTPVMIAQRLMSVNLRFAQIDYMKCIFERKCCHD